MQAERRLTYAVVITQLRDLGHLFNLLPKGWGAQSCWLTFGLVVILLLLLQNSPLNPGVRLEAPSLSYIIQAMCLTLAQLQCGPSKGVSRR